MNIKTFIKEHEGFEDYLYYCSEGYATIGYGHKVTAKDTFAEGINYPKEILEDLFDEDIKIAMIGAKTLLDSELNEPYSQELLDICTALVFQMGSAGLSRFKKFFLALNIPDYGLAASELYPNSKFAKQTPRRAEETAELIKQLGA